MYNSANAFSREISRHYDEAFSDLELTTSYVEILLCIDKNSACSQKKLADDLMLAPSTITRFISKLQKRGLVEKNRTGKSVTVSLTAKGSESISQIKKIYRKADKKLDALLGDRFIETTSKLLRFGADELGKSDERE